MDPISEIRRLRREHSDRLLTLLAVLLAVEMFVFAPLQAEGIFIFQGFEIAHQRALVAVRYPTAYPASVRVEVRLA